MANNDKIERAAVREVAGFLDGFSKMDPNIFANDRTPFWDGEVYLYKTDSHVNENFYARVPLQVKGTTNTADNYYRIGREYVKGYKADRGGIFFVVQEDENYKPLKILYALLSTDKIEKLLQQSTKTVKIELKKMPADSHDFEKGLIRFARERNGERIENPATKEVESLFKKFEDIEKQLDQINDTAARFDLESYLKTIKELKYDQTVEWRDKFIHYSRKIIDYAVNNIKDYDFSDLLFEMGFYLHNQKQYHLVEPYYVDALAQKRVLAKDDPGAYLGDVAMTLNNLAILHSDLNRYDAAEGEYAEALEIYRGLAKANPGAYLGDVARTLNNLANLHSDLNRHDAAEGEYAEALEIRRELAKANPDVYMSVVADSYNSLAYLYASQKDYSKAIEAIDQAIAAMPNDAEYLDSKGEILLMKGDEQGAVEMWRKVMELDPEFLSKYDGETELHRQLKERGLIDR